MGVYYHLKVIKEQLREKQGKTKKVSCNLLITLFINQIITHNIHHCGNYFLIYLWAIYHLGLQLEKKTGKEIDTQKVWRVIHISWIPALFTLLRVNWELRYTPRRMEDMMMCVYMSILTSFLSPRTAVAVWQSPGISRRRQSTWQMNSQEQLLTTEESLFHFLWRFCYSAIKLEDTPSNYDQVSRSPLVMLLSSDFGRPNDMAAASQRICNLGNLTLFRPSATETQLMSWQKC